MPARKHPPAKIMLFASPRHGSMTLRECPTCGSWQKPLPCEMALMERVLIEAPQLTERAQLAIQFANELEERMRAYKEEIEQLSDRLRSLAKKSNDIDCHEDMDEFQAAIEAAEHEAYDNLAWLEGQWERLECVEKWQFEFKHAPGIQCQTDYLT